MTNQIALAILILIVGVFVVDHYWLNMNLPVLTGKALDEFIEYLAFWR